ncbi:serine/arginine rich splicing factor, putative [Theileria equi strain WA]|uniref:Serine/arginine rich splicing factor, putative n=1 Tax=Theileria equi strain WA TaxID=1537102 RepID=L1LFD3_THEEQ|nr:serine/arginine rich splicing factor, putative [Theileria equi strain WA]EKX74066.1 serine/arginine rich splicing factor, putative [Theileria equi strain WA]|eukprot:XP_004833518.1 serine/arginine rich splicing factor, putative [Theileria equi strain WA]
MSDHQRRGGKRRISLLVKNLKYETSPDKVRSLFSRYGEIRDVYLPLDYYTKKPRGFGFVEFYKEEDADEALRGMDGEEIDGNKVEVFPAKHGRSDPREMRHRESRRRDRSYSRGRQRRRRSYSRSRSRRRYRSSSGDRSDRRSRSRSERRSRSIKRSESSSARSVSRRSNSSSRSRSVSRNSS